MSRNEDSPQRFNDDGSDADSDLEELQGDIAKFDESVREFLSSHHGTSKGSKPVRGGFKGGRGSRGPRKAAKPRGDITARLAKVNQAFLAGDYSQALDLVSEVIRINAETHQAWTALASIFREQGEPKRALAAMVYAAHLRDKDFSGWITCATYAMDTMEGEFDEENLKTARLCYSAALKADPTNLEARLAKAAICHRQGHYSQAILEYNLALKNHPADLDIVRKIAEACADNNHSDASVVSAIAAYRTFFDHTKASGAGDLTELWYDIGIYIDLFGARRHYEEGIQELRELSRWIAGRQNEQYWDSIQTDDREWDIDSIRRAEVPQFQNQYSDESKYGSFLPLDMRVRLAVYRFKLDSPTEAMKHMTLLNPDDEEIKYLIEDFPALAFDLAEELRRIENHGDAIKLYELLRALPGDPDPTTLLQLGRCYLATAEDPTAEECFLAAIEADPDIIDARFELAHMYEKVKENEEALILAAEAMALRDARSYAGMRSEAQGAAADTREYAGMPQGVTTKQPATQQLPDHQVNVSQEQTTQVENVGDGVTNHNTFNFRRIMPAPPQDSHHPSRQPLLSTGSIGTPPQIPMYDANMPVDPALGGEIQALPQAGVTGALLSAAIPRLARIQELQSQSGASSRLWPSIPKRYRPKRLAGPAKRVQDEKDRALRLSRQYETVKQLKQQVEAGHSDLVPDWMNASRELIDEFRSLKRFYSWDKYLNFLGSSSADRPVQQPETELSQLYQRLARSTQAEQTNRERTNFPVDNDHGISFDDWLDVFIDYAIALAVEHRQQESYQICEAAKDSTVFQSEEHEFFIYVGWSVCAIYANDEETCVHTARQLMKDKSSSDGYRVFGLLSKLCQSPISWYTSGPAQKYILRQIKAMDSLHEPLFRENSIDMKPGRRRPSNVALDVCLLMLYGHILFTSTSYTYAIGYFLRARALDPENSMISLCLGLAYVHYGLKRQSTNRQYLLLQGHSFIGEYLEMDEGEGARPLAERQYNVGRLFQLLGLNSLSSEYYERAMQANEGEHKIKDIDVSIAVNNVVSSLAVGNKGHAMKVVKEQLILSLDLSEMFTASLSRALATLVVITCAYAQSPDASRKSTDGVAHLTVGDQCEARTINYITHSLPQSCLTNTWTSSATNDAEPPVSTTESVVASETTSTSEQLPPPHAADTAAQEASATPFMSFEDWKEMMLKKTEQDPQAIKARKDNQPDNRARQPQDSDGEFVGDEGEIPLEFENSPYKVTDNRESQPVTSTNEDNDGNGEEAVAYEVGEPRVHRSKDAGKTCKARFSYSSFDAGATILKAGGGAKNAKAILVENKDSYMLMECATPNKYVIVELSDDIQVDTVVLANFEFFSSMIRHFKVSVSDRYPVKLEKWKDLGTFEARNSREIQPFLVENPQIWAKYIRIEFLTHYSNEYYCPLSLLRIHGSRMLDSWKDTDVIDELDDVPFNEDEATMSPPAQVAEEENPTNSKNDQNEPPMCSFHGNPLLYWNGTCGLVCFDVPPPLLQIESSFIDSNYSQEKRHADSKSPTTVSAETFISKPTSTTTDEAPVPVSSTTAAPPKQQHEQQQQATTMLDQHQQKQEQQQQQEDISRKETNTVSSTTSNSEKVVSTTSSSSQTESVSGKLPGASSNQSVNNTASANKTNNATPVSKNRSSFTSSGAASSPTVQEGFFNAITKRLQLVETNLTLSLKYMEEQSLHVQDAFKRAEQKQISKISYLLDHLNGTVLAELHSLRDQYDQIWQSTILALESQRDQSDRDILALSSRLNLLADEVVFQKRMAIVQAVLLLSCLLLVIFSRGVPIPYLGAPQEQGAMATAFAEILASIQKDVYGPDSPPGQRRRSKAAMQGIPQSPVSLNSSPDPASAESSPDPPSGMPESYGGYQRPSPPLTPTRDDPDPSLCSWPAASSSLMHSSTVEQNHVRKPLPSLPEDPASPGL